MGFPNPQQSGYEDIKALISQKTVDSLTLENIKREFENDIASPRRHGSIASLANLISCLESLDVVSPYNVEAFSIIEEFLSDDEILTKLQTYVEPTLEDDVNMYALQRTREINSKLGEESEIKKPVVSQSLSEPKLSDSKRKAVYEVIASEIGRKWQDFGRGLGLRHGDLDNIELKYKSDLRSRVFAIFELFEKDPRCERRMHLNTITEALDSCRRKDLRRSVQKIMQNEDLQ